MIAILGKGAPPNEALGRRMLAAAPHRGSCVALRVIGNCLLGIVNRADGTDQSLSQDGPLMAAMSGHLDNAPELSSVLSREGFAPLSGGDADVAVAAFRAWGKEAPNRMRGAFSGFVTDGQTLHAFRDHVGFRPAFYHEGPMAFTAASEARQVVVGAQIPEEPDQDVLVQILFARMPAETPAALKGVSRLPQGSVLTVNGVGSPVVRRYWNPGALLETARYSADELSERFQALMAQAVARCLTGRDAVLLSGGVDSPAVASFAAPEFRRRTDRPLGALSAVFPDLPAVDERQWIELVAGKFEMDLHTYRPQARALDDVDEWCRVVGSPIPILSIPEVADNHRRAHALGYTNLLTGDFAEFVFGSPMHLVSHLLTRLRLRALVAVLKQEHWRGVGWWPLARQGLGTFVPGRLANWYLHQRGLDAPQRIPDWLDAARIYQLPWRNDLLPPGHRRWERIQHAGLEGSTITMEGDEICGAVTGVTVRRPFADVDLWEFFLGLPAEQKFPDLRFKTLAKQLLRGRVPDEILDRRRKTVFDDHVMTQVDYPVLRRLLAEPRHRVNGVDYRRLAARIERQDLNRFDWHWAQDLARIHAFLNAW